MDNDNKSDEIKFSDKRRLDVKGEEREGVSETKKEAAPRARAEERLRQYRLDFSSFVMSIGTAALVEMGEIEHPVTKKKECNLQNAKHNIDILEILSEKTKNNLDQNEEALLKHLLYEVRMKFISASERKK